MPNRINPTTKARRRYLVEAVICVLALAAITMILSLIGHNLSKRWIVTIVVSGLIPVVFFFAAFVRYTLRTDELNRKMLLDSYAIAGGVTALIAIMYGSLESMSMLPRPHAIWTFGTFVFCFAIARHFLRRRYK
jgi:hypothetical protein